MDVVSNMKLQDWEALNIDELRAMRQYRPKDKLSSRELSNDRSMVLSVMNNLFESTYIEDLAKRIRTDWNSIDPVNLDIERLSVDLAYQMHRTWLRNHRLVAPREKRVRSIPLENFKGEDLERIRKKLKDASYKGLLIDPVKGLSQDINQEPEKLVPQLLEQMNGNLARAYIEQVLAMRASGVDFGPDVLSLLSANVHDLWMEQNKWQVSGILKKLGYDYRRLDVKQIIQIFHQLEKSQWLLMAPNEVEKIYQFSVTEKLSWKDHKRNVDMMALSIQFLANPNSCIRSAN